MDKHTRQVSRQNHHNHNLNHFNPHRSSSDLDASVRMTGQTPVRSSFVCTTTTTLPTATTATTAHNNNNHHKANRFALLFGDQFCSDLNGRSAWLIVAVGAAAQVVPAARVSAASVRCFGTNGWQSRWLWQKRRTTPHKDRRLLQPSGSWRSTRRTTRHGDTRLLHWGRGQASPPPTPTPPPPQQQQPPHKLFSRKSAHWFVVSRLNEKGFSC